MHHKWVVWHIGHQVHLLSSVCLRSQWVIELLTRWPPSTLAKFSLFVTDQSKSAQLVIRSVGRFMLLHSHDLQSMMLERKDRTTPLVTRWQSSTNYTHQCKYRKFKLILHKHVRAMKELTKGKHVFEGVLQWSVVLLNRMKERQNVLPTLVENQTPI